MSAEGLQDSAADPGIRLLAAAVRDVDPRELLLVHSGPLPGLRPGATRLILDVRERDDAAGTTCVPASRGAAARPLADNFAAAVVWPRAHLGKDFSEVCLFREVTGKVFMMREFLGLETDEICTTLDLSTGNCNVILHRARAGLRQGDVILEINRQPVKNAEQATALCEKPANKVTLVKVWSRAGTRFIVVDESKAG
mgnify:CR=1 FL=1